MHNQSSIQRVPIRMVVTMAINHELFRFPLETEKLCLRSIVLYYVLTLNFEFSEVANIDSSWNRWLGNMAAS